MLLNRLSSIFALICGFTNLSWSPLDNSAEKMRSMGFNWKLSQDFARFQERGHFLPRPLNTQDHTLQNANPGDNLLKLVRSRTSFRRLMTLSVF